MYTDPFIALAGELLWLVAGIMVLAFGMFAAGMAGGRDEKIEQGPRTIVVVDDDSDVRRGVRTLIENRTPFHVVGEAHDGAEGIRTVDAVLPDLVLMDVKLPEVDGIEATRRIKELHPQIRVIGFSSSEDDPTGAIMRRAGASAHLVKGDSPERILETINDFA